MWIGLVIGLMGGGAQLVKSFARRGEPEPPNNRLKLPFMSFLGLTCVGIAAFGVAPVLFVLLAVVCTVEVGFVLASRNPWWMQSPLDRRKGSRYSSGLPRDQDPSP
jgi:hypothetical protein